MRKATIKLNGREYRIKQSLFATNEVPFLISDFMSGKMEGIPSGSTSCKCNKLCQNRMKNGNAICAECFAEQNLSFKKSLRDNCESNYYLMNENDLTKNEIPLLKKWVEIFRHESYGDTASIKHAANQLRITKANPHVVFADWTKNPWFLADAIEQEGDAENAIHVHSSMFKNKRNDEAWQKYPHIDIVFTVYTQEYIDTHPEEKIEINCGLKKCDECRFCYDLANKRKHGQPPKFVNELVKRDQMKKRGK